MSKKKQYLLLAIFVLIFPVFWFVFSISFRERFGPNKLPQYWNLNDIVEYLEIDFPDEATDVKYEVGPNHHFFIDLSFDAPPLDAMAFAESVCGGMLHSNYDPFHAVDSLAAIPNANLIRVWPWYYSYSVTATDMVGNRCLARRGHDQQIVVNKRRPDSYTVHYELSVGCGYEERRIPCYSPYASTYRARISGFPYEITGFTSPNSDTPTYTLVAQELCFLQSMFFEQQDGDAFIGATVKMNVDNVEIPDGYVAENSNLLKGDADDLADDVYATYCLPNEWSSGAHTLIIDVTMSDGSEQHFDWRFNVE